MLFEKPGLFCSSSFGDVSHSTGDGASGQVACLTFNSIKPGLVALAFQHIFTINEL